MPAYPDPERGAIGREWLSGRLYGHGVQIGRYAEVTHAETIAYLIQAGVFEQLGIPPRDVDAASVKDARQRHITRSIARFLYDQQDATLRPVVDGITFRPLGAVKATFTVGPTRSFTNRSQLASDQDSQPVAG